MNTKIILLGIICMFVFLAYPVVADANDTFSVVATPPLMVLTNDSTNVEKTTATLNGFLLGSGGAICQYRFEYDIDSGVPYTFSTAWTGAITTGDIFSQDVSSLTKGELYFFRAQCRNAEASSGDEKSFLTKPDDPGFFNALGQTKKIRLTWTKGNGADLTVVVRKQGSYPSDISDGTVVYNDTGGMYDDTNVSIGIYYYYRAWSYCSEGGLYQYSDSYDEDSAKAFAPVPPVIPLPPPPLPPAVEEVAVAVMPWSWILGVSAVVLVGVFIVIAIRRDWFLILLAKRRREEQE